MKQTTRSVAAETAETAARLPMPVPTGTSAPEASPPITGGHESQPEKFNKEATAKDDAIALDPYAHLPPEQAELLRNQAAVPPPRTVRFYQLFRFHTPLELFLNVIGLLFAIASGVAIPSQMLLFGQLTTSTTNFVLARETTGVSDQLRDQLFSDVDQAALILLGVGLAVWITIIVYGTIWSWTGECASRRIRESYLKAVLRQNVAFHDATGTGTITTQIINNTHLVQEAISEKVALTAKHIGAFVGGFVIAYITNARIAGVATVIVPLIILTGAVMDFYLGKYKKKNLDLVSAGGNVAEESFSSVRIVQSFGIQRHMAGLYDYFNAQTLPVGRKNSMVNAIGFGVFFSLIYLAYSLSFWYGIGLYLDGNTTSGELITAFFSVVIGSFSLINITPNLAAFSSGVSAAGQLFDTIDRQPPIDSASDEGLKLPDLKGDVEFNNVNFFYPSRPTVQVLYDVNLKLPRGKHTALVGASGSGKSSILALIERWYEPISGTIKLDDHEIHTLNLKWMRSQIGFVQQEPVLVNSSVFTNIAHGLIGSQYEHESEERKRELVYQAAKDANAYDFIEKLPEKWETRLGERGSLVSGGQKQRIAIARAIVGNPSILLLDEATSALDTTSEKLVQEALDKASKGRTTCSIAHRLSTIKDADHIVVMGAGKVIETGTHDSLVAQGGAYKTLVDAQAFVEADNPEEAISEKGHVGSEQNEKRPGQSLQRSATSKSVPDSVYGRIAEESEDKAHSLLYLFRRMGRVNSDQKLKYALGIAGATVSGLIFPVFSIVFGQLVAVFSETDPEVIRADGNRGALYFLILAIVATLAVLLQQYYLYLVAEILSQRLRTRAFTSILRQDIRFFDQVQNSAGGLTSRISKLPQSVFGLAGSVFGIFVQSFITLLIGFVVALVYAPKVAAVGIACSPLTLAAGYLELRLVVMREETNKKAHESSARLAAESASSIRTVSSLTREEDCLANYSDALDGPQRRALRSSFLAHIILGLIKGVGFLILGLIFYYGSRQLVNGLDVGNFFIALSATIFGTEQAGEGFQYAPDFSKAASSASQLVNLFDREVEVDADSKDGAVLSDCQGHITLKDVHFRYPTRPDVPVLRGLNLECKPGQFIALVGESGCGKSTTTALLERFYDPAKGQIFIGGHDIRQLNVSSYRSQLALVSQEPTLFAGSLRFNVLLGATKDHADVSEEEVIEACRKANILDFIQSLPDGFDTEVGNKGVSLSGGQKQRLAIARALIRNPRVLLLDEATSALDSTSERVVQAALDQAAKGRSTISIAHRLSTIQHADVIYVFAKGRIQEQGTHQQLIALKGHYAELVQKQAVSAN